MQAPDLVASSTRVDALAAMRPGTRLTTGIVVVGVGYWLLAQLGSVVQYPGGVEVVWLPVGWAAAMLYLGDLRWFVGAMIADLILGAGLVPSHYQRLLEPTTVQTLSNTVEFTLAAVLMRRWLGPRNALARPVDVGWLLLALGIGTAVAAAVGALTIVWAGQARWGDYGLIARTWWLGDTSGGLLLAPLLIVWGADRWRPDRREVLQGGLIVAVIAGLSFVLFESSHPLTYLVFPALMLAAVSLGQRGATVGVVVAVAVAVGLTASESGPFVEHSINDEVLKTQLYILIASLTTLTLGAAISAGRRAAVQVAESRRREAERTADERQRIAADLHDSVSQTLFSLGLHAGIAKHELGRARLAPDGPLPTAVDAIAQLAQGALLELRAAIFDLRSDAVAERGVVAALAAHASALGLRHDVTVDIDGPPQRLPLSAEVEELLFRIGQEALTNAVKHSGSPTVSATVAVADGQVVLTVSDTGVGFDPAFPHTGHLGLELIRSRAGAAGAMVDIQSVPERGSTVRVAVPAMVVRPQANRQPSSAPPAPRPAPPASVS